MTSHDLNSGDKPTPKKPKARGSRFLTDIFGEFLAGFISFLLFFAFGTAVVSAGALYVFEITFTAALMAGIIICAIIALMAFLGDIFSGFG